MFKVFEVPREVEGKTEKGYQIFWCPSAPMHYADKIPHDDKVYSKKQAAYRRRKQLQDDIERTNVIKPALSLKLKQKPQNTD